MSTITTQPKQHYIILDALRGVAALTVVAFHIMEAHATSHFDQMINHGYLAVDFFFMLSGFVIAYAYDDRWNSMSLITFFKRRVVRLQPMLIPAMIIGAAFFYLQDSPMWPQIHSVPIWKTVLVMFIGFTLIPLPTSMDIRGWQEMHPLNGPAWSLFFEYIANILYALIIRKCSNITLMILIVISAIALVHLGITSPNGDIIGGWTLNSEQLYIGFTRLGYPFLAGLLLCRMAKIRVINNSFMICSVLLLIVLILPRVGDATSLWVNGLYDALVVILVFPFIIWLGAGGTIRSDKAKKCYKFLGDLSYPIYITHYPLVYTYTAWVSSNKPAWQSAVPWAILTFISAVIVAYICFIYYDRPVRKLLARKM